MSASLIKVFQVVGLAVVAGLAMDLYFDTCERE